MKDESGEELDQIAECLTRSGYYMEARIITLLVQEGYFVEASPPFLDPRTGKSRELDFVAERFDWDPEQHHRGVSIKTNFVVEAMNNRFPFVLMTPAPYSPTANDEDQVKYLLTPETANPFIEEINDFLFVERCPAKETLFAQFAEITRKNGKTELMASHGDGTYQSMLKLSEFIEAQLNEIDEEFRERDRFWRLHFWRPMLVLGGKLAIQEARPDELKLRYANFAQLVFNWHDHERPRSTVIDVVTEDYLLTHMTQICNRDTEVAFEVGRYRAQQFPSD